MRSSPSNTCSSVTPYLRVDELGDQISGNAWRAFHMDKSRLRAGREIFAKGSPGQSLMAVLQGSVKISSLSDSGKEIVFTIFNAGEIFGEIATLDGDERSADATALTDCEFLVLNRRDLLPVLENRADLCMALLKVLCRKLRLTTEQVEDVIFRDLESRVAKALVQLAESVGPRGIHSPSVELHLSQRELANMAGCSRESVNKHLQIWHRQGLMDLSKGDHGPGLGSHKTSDVKKAAGSPNWG